MKSIILRFFRKKIIRNTKKIKYLKNIEKKIQETRRKWNLQAIRTLVEPQDAKMIESIPLGRNQMEDRNGWHLTNNGKYTVQSGYQIERIYPDKEKPPLRTKCGYA